MDAWQAISWGSNSGWKKRVACIKLFHDSSQVAKSMTRGLPCLVAFKENFVPEDTSNSSVVGLNTAGAYKAEESKSSKSTYSQFLIFFRRGAGSGGSFRLSCLMFFLRFTFDCLFCFGTGDTKLD